MSMIDRYKKPGGFSQLLSLLESCGAAKKEKFLKIINDESPHWHDALKERLLTLELILSWPPEILAEITSRAQPITMAAIAKGLDEAHHKKLFTGLNHSQYAKIRGLIEDGNFNAAQTNASIDKLLAETRSHIQSGLIKLEKFAPHLAIPEDFENTLESMLGSMPALPPSEVFNEKATARITSSQGGSAPSAQTEEEMSMLRRQIYQLQLELQNLRKMNSVMKDKLDQIKKIA